MDLARLPTHSAGVGSAAAATEEHAEASGPTFQVPDWSGDDKGVRRRAEGGVSAQEEARWRRLGAARVCARYVEVCCGGAGMARREAAGAGVCTEQARLWGEKPVLVAGSPRVGLTRRTASRSSLGSRAGATSHRVDCEMSSGVA